MFSKSWKKSWLWRFNEWGGMWHNVRVQKQEGAGSCSTKNVLFYPGGSRKVLIRGMRRSELWFLKCPLTTRWRIDWRHKSRCRKAIFFFVGSGEGLVLFVLCNNTGKRQWWLRSLDLFIPYKVKYRACSHYS